MANIKAKIGVYDHQTLVNLLSIVFILILLIKSFHLVPSLF